MIDLRTAVLVASGSLIACGPTLPSSYDLSPDSGYDAGQARGQLDLYEGKRQAGTAAGPVEVQLSTRMKNFDPKFVHQLASVIEEEAASQGLDPMLVLAVIDTESSFNPKAVSPRDAQGLMQLKKRTMEYEALRTGLVIKDSKDPLANVRTGIRYLGRLRRAFRQVEVTLIAYNAGPHRVWEWKHSEDGQIPEQFYTYPKTVLRKYKRFSHDRSSPFVASR